MFPIVSCQTIQTPGRSLGFGSDEHASSTLCALWSFVELVRATGETGVGKEWNKWQQRQQRATAISCQKQPWNIDETLLEYAGHCWPKAEDGLSDEFLSAFDGFYVVPAWNAARSGTQKFWPQTSKNGRIDTQSHPLKLSSSASSVPCQSTVTLGLLWNRMCGNWTGIETWMDKPISLWCWVQHQVLMRLWCSFPSALQSRCCFQLHP